MYVCKYTVALSLATQYASLQMWKRVATRGPFFSSADRQTLARACPRSSHTLRATHARQSSLYVTEKRKLLIGNFSCLEYMRGRNSVPTTMTRTIDSPRVSEVGSHTMAKVLRGPPDAGRPWCRRCRRAVARNVQGLRPFPAQRIG